MAAGRVAGRLGVISSHLSSPSVLRPFSASAMTPTESVEERGESFIDVAKREGAGALLGWFQTTKRFDRTLRGMEITSLGSGEVECVLEVGERVMNAFGTLHGGAVATIVDVVGTLALLSSSPTTPGVSIDLNVSFARAAPGGSKVRIEGKLLKLGKKLAFTEVSLYDKDSGKLIATGRHTKSL